MSHFPYVENSKNEIHTGSAWRLGTSFSAVSCVVYLVPSPLAAIKYGRSADPAVYTNDPHVTRAGEIYQPV